MSWDFINENDLPISVGTAMSTLATSGVPVITPQDMNYDSTGIFFPRENRNEVFGLLGWNAGEVQSEAFTLGNRLWVVRNNAPGPDPIVNETIPVDQNGVVIETPFGNVETPPTNPEDMLKNHIQNALRNKGIISISDEEKLQDLEDDSKDLFKVKFYTDSGRIASVGNVSNVKTIARIFKPWTVKMEKNIWISSPGKPSPLPIEVNPENFYIRLYSHVDSYSTSSINDIFGNSVGGNCRSFLKVNDNINGGGFSIKSGSNTIATYFPDHQTLYIHFGLNKIQQVVSKEMKLIMDEIYKNIILINENKDEFLEKMKRETFKKFADSLVERSNRRVRELESEIKNSNRQIEQIFSQIRGWDQKILETTKNIESLRESIPLAMNKVTDELMGISKIQGVKSFYISGQKLIVDTDFIHTKKLRDKTIRRIGEIVIEINLETSSIILRNKTHMISGLAHPHCYENDQSVCWGNIKDGIYQMIREMEIRTLVAVIVDFLRSPNEEDSYGRRVIRWPEETDAVILENLKKKK